jgi:hypothetical protein
VFSKLIGLRFGYGFRVTGHTALHTMTFVDQCQHHSSIFVQDITIIIYLVHSGEGSKASDFTCFARIGRVDIGVGQPLSTQLKFDRKPAFVSCQPIRDTPGVVPGIVVDESRFPIDVIFDTTYGERLHY